jgi:hypothetical protein
MKKNWKGGSFKMAEKKNNIIVISEIKNKKSLHRAVGLSKRYLNELGIKARMGAGYYQFMNIFKPNRKDDFKEIWKANNGITPKNPTQTLKRLWEKRGIREISLMDLCHTAFYMLLLRPQLLKCKKCPDGGPLECSSLNDTDNDKQGFYI